MSNTLVSIRIPKKLLEELRQAAEKDHFLDLSEAVRSITRKKWMQHKDPNAYQLEALKQEIKERVTKKAEENARDEQYNELKKLLKELIDKDSENKEKTSDHIDHTAEKRGGGNA